jgi:hypothetical protein
MADSPVGTIGPVQWGSNAVNGQLVPQAPSSAFFPTYMGSTYVNPKWPSTAPFQVPPVVPSANQSPVGGGYNGFGMGEATPGVVSTQANAPSGNPWHPTQGTIAFGFFALVAGLFMLHYIHYSGGS